MEPQQSLVAVEIDVTVLELMGKTRIDSLGSFLNLTSKYL